jgi:hypothetical protein
MQLIRLDSNPNTKPDEYPDNHPQVEYSMEQIEDIIPEASTVKVGFRMGGAKLRFYFDGFRKGLNPSYAL